MERLTLEEAINHAKEVAMQTELNNCKECSENHKQLAEWLEELKAYKDLEKQDLLVRLPCPIGTEVYCIIAEITGKHPIMFKTRFSLELSAGIEKFVFLTREEAEKKLEEMQK